MMGIGEDVELSELTPSLLTFQEKPESKPKYISIVETEKVNVEETKQEVIVEEKKQSQVVEANVFFSDMKKNIQLKMKTKF